MPTLIPWWAYGPGPDQSYGPDPKTLNALATAQTMGLRGEEADVARQGRNALRQMYANPANIDPTTGMPTPNALRQVGIVAPEAALTYTQEINKAREQGLRSQLISQKINQETAGRLMTEVGDPAAAAYYDVLNKTGDQQQAQVAGQKAYTDALDRVGKEGWAGPGINNIPRDFDINRYIINSAGIKGLLDQQRADAEERRKRTEEARKGPDLFTGEVDGKPASFAKTPEGKMRNVDTDEIVPSADIKNLRPIAQEVPRGYALVQGKDAQGNPISYFAAPGQPSIPAEAPGGAPAGAISRVTGAGGLSGVQGQLLNQYIQEHPESTAEDRANFVQSMRPVRSAAGMTLQKFIQENPGATSADIAAFNAWSRARGTGEVAFATGVEGRSTKALDVAMDHLSSVSELVTALKNHDERTVNRIGNYLQTELGLSSAPITFEAARSIVGAEIVKAVQGGASALGDRKEAREPLDPALPPQELLDIIAEDKRLMAGQLKGLEQQYMAFVVPPDKRGDKAAENAARQAYRYKLFPETVRELESARTPGSSTTPTPPPGGTSATVPPPAGAAPSPAAPAAAAPSPSTPAVTPYGRPARLRRGHEKEDFDNLGPGAHYLGPDDDESKGFRIK